MDEKKFSIFVLVFIFLVAIPGAFFLFSDSSITGQAISEPIYSWVYNGREVHVYPDRVVAFDFRPELGTGFHYSSRPIIEKRFGKKMGCPKDCYSVRYEDVQDFQNLGFRIDLLHIKLV